MRLIDADALLKAVKSSMESGTLYLPIEFCDLIEKVPTADVVERKKGKWIKDGHHIRCDRCERYMCDTDREGDRIPLKFCPNCGADMREEKTDEKTIPQS